MRAELPLTVDKVKTLLDGEAGIDYERLVQLLIQGIFVKQLCLCLYVNANKDVCHNPPTFSDVLLDMRC